MIRLRVVDPTAAAAAVARASGAELGPDGRTVALANAALVFDPAERRHAGPAVEVGSEPEADPADGLPTGSPGGRVLAVGWATVDADRLARDLVPSPGSAQSTRADATRDPVLGARLLPIGRPPGGLFDVVLLEPDTEGPLAAGLARHGEGPAVVYVAPASGIRAASAHLAGSRSGPWVVVVGSHPPDDRVPSLG